MESYFQNCVYLVIQIGGGMASAEAYEIGAQASPVCEYCGDKWCDDDHLIW